MDDLIKYFPTKGGYVVGKSNKAKHPNIEKLPDYNPEEDLDFLPLLNPKKVVQQGSQGKSSKVFIVDDPVVSNNGGNDNVVPVDDEFLFVTTYQSDQSIELDEVNCDSEDEEMVEPDIDADEEIRFTCQIQSTLSSNDDFKEFVLDTHSISGEYEMAEKTVEVEKLFVGQEWKNVDKCRNYLKDLAIETTYGMTQVKNFRDKQQYKCKFSDCPWKIYCAVFPDGQTMQCKSGHFTHTCESFHGLKHPLANAKWVSKVMLESFKAHPNFKPNDFITEVKRERKVDISYYTAWHGYQLTLEKIMGNYEEGYMMLPALCKQILDENPRNIAKCKIDPETGRFISLCIAYRVSLDGFRIICRPILGVDGTHLKGKYGGTLLAIVGLDANNGIFPIAIYICKSECKESWTYFLSILAPELKQHKRALTFISDRQKGLVEGIARNFDDVNYYHRFCFRHLYKNFKIKHPGKNLEFIVWREARSYSEVGHKIWMERLKEAKVSAAEWFNDKLVEQWERAYFDRSSKCDHITSNFCEAFNAWILEFRFLPITKLVQKFHLLMMRIFFDREQVGKTLVDGGVVSRVTTIINKHLYFSHEFSRQPSTESVWTILDTKKDISWIVNLLEHTCTCNAWQISGIPCVHAICASLHNRPRNVEQYVHPYMKVDNYRQLYVPSIKPLKDKALWEKVLDAQAKVIKCKHFKVSRPTGRPRSQRRRDNDEMHGRNSRRYMCGKCYTYGHNRKTCTGATAENLDQAPDTFTGPHVRPPASTRPLPPASATTEASTASASETRTRGTKRKRGGGAATAASAHNEASEFLTPTTTRGGTGRGNRGGRGIRGGRGFRDGITTVAATVSEIPNEKTAPTSEMSNEAFAPATTSSTATTTVAFGRKTTIEGPRSKRGRPLRGRGARGYAKGKTVHRRGGQIVGIGIMYPEEPRLVREPVQFPTASAQSQILNPTGRGGGVRQGCGVQRGGGSFMRAGGAFSTTSVRGNRRRMMDWLGTPEQWANDERSSPE